MKDNKERMDSNLSIIDRIEWADWEIKRKPHKKRKVEHGENKRVALPY